MFDIELQIVVIYIELFCCEKIFGIGVYMSFIKSKKFLISAVAVVLVAAIVVAIVVISSRPKALKNYSYIAENQASVKFDESFDVVIEGLSSEKMLINGTNGAVALVTSDGKTVFNSCSADASEYSLATVLSIRLRDGSGNSYTMNSTDNSVSFNGVSVEDKGDGSVSVKFDVFPDAERAKKGVGKADVFASVTVDFSYENGAFKSNVDTRKVVVPEGFCLEKISVLPGLFSINTGASGDYYLVPDGCGALVQLNAVNEADYSLNLGMYGTDNALYGYSIGAYLPYYSYIKGNCFINTIITEGDALSEISFKKFSRGGGYLYNTFTVTACGVVGGEYVCGPSYQGDITQIYYLTEDNDDYNEIALQVRDVLIGKGYLSDGLREVYAQLPAYVGVIGSEKGNNPATTFEQAAEITTMLKSKGVSNIALRFIGGGKDGFSTVAGDSFDFSSSVGGKDGAVSLGNKMNEQGNSLYVDYNMFVGKAEYRKTTANIYGDFTNYAGYGNVDFTVLDTEKVNSNVSKAYKFLEDKPNLNICLNDGSKLLYTDIEGGVNRQYALGSVQRNLNSLVASSNVMLSSPAVYLMKYVDGVYSLPEAASLQSYSGVTSVPILQIALHGSIVYGTNPINVSALSSGDALLKSVEFGAVPSFVFTHSELESLGYSAYVNDTALLYEKASRMLPLLGMGISSHELVVPGVYKVVYDYSKIVYVNYNPSVVEVEGIMIAAKDFVII